MNVTIADESKFLTGLESDEVPIFEKAEFGVESESCPPGKVPIHRNKHGVPRLYGDNKTRFTAYWTTDNYKSGCYNVECPGFVQMHPYYHLGQDIGNASISGLKQYVVDLGINQDHSTGNWWLIIYGTEKVGYWPKEHFNHLNEGASFVQYCGWRYISSDGISPPMGSSSLPTLDYKTSSFFAQVKTADSSYTGDDIDFGTLYGDTSPQCYDVKYFYNQGGKLRKTFAYGGTGGKLSLCGT
ncbi:hypothetical protein L6164_003177 [Bauhinia variegata]|uniref:Uncharacterized protein n=1 Tax=Bauhinia variegata TaxID=167791 RepID=A0ACB9Q0P0_BAUVA|nr:hypothetical protein L6164_003177 [Bauhinia variegata]